MSVTDGVCPNCAEDLPDRDPPVSFCPACGAAQDVSVRPPDLAPADLPDTADPLEGWDRDPRAVVSASGLVRATDGPVVAAGTLAGFVVGVALGPTRRTRAGLVGAVAGAVLAAVARRVWELPPPDDGWARARQD